MQTATLSAAFSLFYRIMLPEKSCSWCFAETASNQVCSACGYGLNGKQQYPAQQLPPGTLLNDQYQIGMVLGQGSFGITYLCYDLKNDQKVAIKEYFPFDYACRNELDVVPLCDSCQDAVISGLEFFFDEVKVLMEFNSYPRIVKIIDYLFMHQTVYFVMEYISGMSLKERLEQEGGRLDFPEIWRILEPVMGTLDEIHRGHLLHRDIAPDNLILDDAGQAKLVDFGSARLALSTGVVGSSLTLKPGYAPLEQYRNFERQGPWTDIYQMGAVFYRALTGRIPLDSLERTAVDTLQSPAQLGISLPETADRAIMKALAMRTEDRFQTFAEMIAAFEIQNGEENMENEKLTNEDSKAEATTTEVTETPVQSVQPEKPSKLESMSWIELVIIGIVLTFVLYFMLRG